jgi:hypothetical protein
MKLADYLDFQQNQALNLVVHPSTSILPTPVNGQIFTQTGGTLNYSSGTNAATATTSLSAFLGYNGTNWVRLDNIYNSATDIFNTTATPTNGISSGTFTVGNLITTTGGKLTDSGYSLSTISLGGDVTGTTSSNTLSKIQGVTLTVSSLAGGNTLLYNGTKWVNSEITLSLTGEVTGTATLSSTGALNATNMIVAKLLAKSLPAALPTSTGNLRYNTTSAAWEFDTTTYLTAASGVTSFNGYVGAVTITQGTGISFISAANSIQINNTGVLSIASGDTNINVTAGSTTTLALNPTVTVTTLKTTNFYINGTQQLTYNSVLTNSTDIVTKLQLDNMSFGLRDFKESCRYATTTNLAVAVSGDFLTLTASANGILSVDGYTPNVGDRILVMSQTAQAQNGIYTVSVVGTASTKFVLVRSSDFNTMGNGTTGNISSGAFMYVSEGTTYAKTGWVVSSIDSTLSTLGTSSIVFAQFSGAGTYVQGTNIVISGTTINLSTTLTGLSSVTTTSLITTNFKFGSTAGVLVSNASGVVSAVPTLGVANGGTGLSSWSVYAIPYASAATTLSGLAPNTSTSIKALTMTGTGSAGAAPVWTAIVTSVTATTPIIASTTSTTGVVALSHATSGITAGTYGVATYDQYGHAISGITISPIAYGGTGLSSYTAGDMLYYSSGTTLSKLAKGTAGQVLGISSTGLPEYKTIQSGSPSLLTINTSTNGVITISTTANNASEWNSGSLVFATTLGLTTWLVPSTSTESSSDGSTVYLVPLSHNMGSVPRGVNIRNEANGEILLATLFSISAANLSGTGPYIYGSTTDACVRLSATAASKLSGASPSTISVTLYF